MVECKSGSDTNNHPIVSSSFYDINISTVSSEHVALSKIKKSKASVFFFMSPECPICENYSLTINEIIETFKDKNIDFYCIFPGTYYNRNQILEYLTKFKMEFIPLLDPQLLLTKNINAKVMPETFVIESSGTILYHGSIDNLYYSIGKQRTIVTEHYLKDVLENIVNNKPFDAKNTEAIGCFIE